ncbi:hypothetical protein KHC23_11760 [Ancylobacter dichloromethanicus]|uniref:Uncharacterized protein n=1 Tax=Ancylobacter dichloromethanicus TaxID=518825 RepID=A0A9W6J6V6_9HYPH|nr:hypothetical protein [Ancylobacter dichloromethanicus]MBS7554327.1 hypothetical protein [Ancylobacter dichloromethanicus]GLK71452.1 hypothetical protein GCM10017643_15670 [Ancylobacter dichloromethanicus]
MTTATDISRRIAETVQPRLGRIAEHEVGILPVDTSGDGPNWTATIARQGGGGHAYRQWRLEQLRTAVESVRREIPRIDWNQ